MADHLGKKVLVGSRRAGGFSVRSFQAYLEPHRPTIAGKESEVSVYYIRFATPEQKVVCVAAGESQREAEDALVSRMIDVYQDCYLDNERGTLNSPRNAYLEALKDIILRS